LTDGCGGLKSRDVVRAVCDAEGGKACSHGSGADQDCRMAGPAQIGDLRHHAVDRI
jgi:hypothetical protein